MIYFKNEKLKSFDSTFRYRGDALQSKIVKILPDTIPCKKCWPLSGLLCWVFEKSDFVAFSLFEQGAH